MTSLPIPSDPPALADALDDPANAIYDAACELLLATRELERAASRDGIASALPATLGCLDEALESLAASVHAMGSEALLHMARQPADDEFVAISRKFGTIRRDLLAARRRLAELRAAVASLAA